MVVSRQVSRETGISTPTVKARFERLVNIGFIKAVIPIIDMEKVQHNDSISELQRAMAKSSSH
jgi:DNA-binding Lrp family transcriptional regulator